VTRVGKLGFADTNSRHSSSPNSFLVIAQHSQGLIIDGKMSAHSQRTDQDDRDLEPLDSVMGSATACANISAKLIALKKPTAGCLSGPVGRLVNNFSSISQDYAAAGRRLQHSNSVWGENVSLSIKFTQERCQPIATELPTILEHYGEWDVLADANSCQRLNMLSKILGVFSVQHALLFKVLDLVPVLARKPAEHESLDSIVIPDVTNWKRLAIYAELRARLRAAEFAAKRMDRWSTDCATSFDLVRKAICLARKRSTELLGYRVASGPQALQPSTPERISTVDDWSTTQSTTGIMTSTEDWSDVGSDTTEIFRTPAITRHSLQLCRYATASFLRLTSEIHGPLSRLNIFIVDTKNLQRLHRAFGETTVQLLHALDAPVPSQSHLSQISPVGPVTSLTLRQCIEETRGFLYRNNLIEESFGHLPGSTPVGTADVEAMHKAYSNLVDTLLSNLAAPIPFQNDRFAPTPVPAQAPVPVPGSAPDVPRPVTPEVQNESWIDKTLEAIINSMEAAPTEKDIMKLVFHWTTLEECNGHKRTEVMQFD
jgi:hypothetical protein